MLPGDEVFYVVESNFDIRIETARLLHHHGSTFTVSSKKWGIVYISKDNIFKNIIAAKEKENIFIRNKINQIKTQIEIREKFISEFKLRLTSNINFISQKRKLFNKKT